MTEENAEAPAPQAACRLDELLLAQAQRLPARQTRIDHPAAYREDEDHVARARAEHARDGDGEEDERKGELHIRDAHRDVVEASREVAGEQPQANADGQRQAHGEEADQERDARAVDDAGEDVAPELVGSQEIFRASSSEPGW